MFARIAGVYDLLNRLLSLGIDRRWRRAMLAVAGPVDGRLVVDSCCGTGDVAFEFARAGAHVVGVDFTPEMLTRAQAKSAASRAPRGATHTRAPHGATHARAPHGATHARAPHGATIFAHGDALALPVQSASADFCTNAFGIRNVADRRAGIREMSRVLRPGGRVVILEFTMPPGRVLGALYRLYFTRVLPLVGRIVSRDGEAYAYLPRTVLAWPSPGELQRELEGEGLVECGHQLLTRGIACLHWGRVPHRGSA